MCIRDSHKTDTALRQVQFLVIAPTRELCLQIADDLKDYAIYNKDIKIAAIFGGSSMDRQIQKIKQGAQIISATPGRLNDLIDRGEVNLNKVKAVILDEADEMLNICLLYTSDAADERSSVDLGGRRIIKKKKTR